LDANYGKCVKSLVISRKFIGFHVTQHCLKTRSLSTFSKPPQHSRYSAVGLKTVVFVCCTPGRNYGFQTELTLGNSHNLINLHVMIGAKMRADADEDGRQKIFQPKEEKASAHVRRLQALR